ncbi:glutamine-dependent NAD(+) synthetase [Physocladia obscura]|uniref:NAD(+) synthase (glutamine-hydrolyzing) n=1 Tax=Physocladia obscura TaxID=109957 RepID=A0AAD5XH91_9FUNG|nr:glutamine-dependent NAD(+) synthetase [Physocladia obscura]
MFLANDGNYRETRWFTAWTKTRQFVNFTLPQIITDIIGQDECPFGDSVIETKDTTIGSEICEELWTSQSPHISMSLDGVEIFTNGSGSHHEFGKLHVRVDLMRNATAKCGGVYMYANQHGCDGERVYYDGCALIVVNGDVIAQGRQFFIEDVEVITATVDLTRVRAYRAIASRGVQASAGGVYPRVKIETRILKENLDCKETEAIGKVFYHTPSEEIRFGPACWLWDYLRRSKTNGYFLPLSGGIDSCSTALIVYSMCKIVCETIAADSLGSSQVLKDVQHIVGNSSYIPANAKELCSHILHTSYMGTSNSSNETRNRATRLAKDIGSYHVNLNMDSVVSAVLGVFQTVTGKTPQFKMNGGTVAENLALQNIQARSRMVLSYLFAQLLPWCRSKQGALLVLGSANVDETLRGYFTKYDCASADVNPIGGISKKDLKGFVQHCVNAFDLPILEEFLHATPTAELEPILADYVQSDEVDMGMSYDDLSVYGKLRKISKCGPYQMFTTLVGQWSSMLSPSAVAEKVKKFFRYYAINRHKTTILPPSYHMSPYSPDDNRFDLRPILYNASWSWQFEHMDIAVKKMEEVVNQSQRTKHTAILFQHSSVKCYCDNNDGSQKIRATDDIRAGSVLLIEHVVFGNAKFIRRVLKVDSAFSVQLHPRSAISESEHRGDFSDIDAKIEANAFFGADGTLRLGPAATRFNHSCTPNCIVRYAYEHSPFAFRDGERRDGFATIYSVSDIKPGDEICYQYNIHAHDMFACSCSASDPADRAKTLLHNERIVGPPIVERNRTFLEHTIADYLNTREATCAYCSSSPVKNLCKGCEAVSFCNTKCLQADWSAHKIVCKRDFLALP